MAKDKAGRRGERACFMHTARMLKKCLPEEKRSF